MVCQARLGSPSFGSLLGLGFAWPSLVLACLDLLGYVWLCLTLACLGLAGREWHVGLAWPTVMAY